MDNVFSVDHFWDIFCNWSKYGYELLTNFWNISDFWEIFKFGTLFIFGILILGKILTLENDFSEIFVFLPSTLWDWWLRESHSWIIIFVISRIGENEPISALVKFISFIFGENEVPDGCPNNFHHYLTFYPSFFTFPHFLNFNPQKYRSFLNYFYLDIKNFLVFWNFWNF